MNQVCIIIDLCFSTPIKEDCRQAVINDHDKVVAYLIQQGFQPDFILACRKGSLKVVKLLLPLSEDIIKQRGLHQAITNGHTNTVKLLLDAGVDTQGIYGWTALHVASESGYGEIVKLLLKTGLNPNLQTYREKTTALHLASEKGNIEVVKQLLKAGADPNLRDEEGLTPLVVAKNKKIASLLIKIR